MAEQSGSLDARRRLEALAELRRLIADDAWATTFQTMGQYRTALLQYLRYLTALPAEPQPSLVAAFNPDWSLLKATQESLREHMALLAGYNTLVALVREWQEATLAYRAASEAFQDAVRSRSTAAEDRVATAAYHRMVAAENELLAFRLTPAARDAVEARP